MSEINHVEPLSETVQLLDADRKKLEQISLDMSLGLSTEEMSMLQNYFLNLGRNPTDVEMQAMAQAWSEHCCYKSSKFYLKKYFSGLEKHDAMLAMEDDAGVVSFDDDYAYVVKMESHNHPSALEPYGGAATGVGGILRDILCMGAQPVGLLDSIYFGEVWNNSIKGKGLHPRFVLNNVVGGIRDYGNRVGIPNIAGSVEFDKCFNNSPLVNAGCIGIVRKDKISRSLISKVGDLLLLVGGRTGRDGIHGVNFASAILTEGSEEKKSVVQLGNPIIKEPLIHAVLEANEDGLIDGMKDLGGGGLSSSVGEICLAGGVSAIVQLDKVLLKEEGMKPWEIWVSESQERMLLAISPENLEKISKIFHNWDIEFSIIGEVVSGTSLVLNYEKEKVLDLDLNFLTSGPVYCRNYELPKKEMLEYVIPPEDLDLKVFLQKFLGAPSNCTRQNILRQYDHTVRGDTVIRPLTGMTNGETHSDASVIKPLEHSMKGLAVTAGSRYDMVAVDPMSGTFGTMTEAYLNVLVTGAKPSSVVDCLNMGNPEEPKIMGQLIQVLESMSEFCTKMELPVVAGNVSLYNQYSGSNIKPVPNIMMVGVMDDVSKAISADFKETGNHIFIIGRESSSLGGSQYLKFRNIDSNTAPWFDMDELKQISEKYREAYSRELILSAHDVSNGGLIQTLLEMSFGFNKGFHIDLSDISDARTLEKIFSEGGERIVVEVKPENREEFIKVFDEVKITEIGKTTSGEINVIDRNITILEGEIKEFKEPWLHGLDNFI
jgi:phosphoribosylformylglycinamidine synthase